MPSSLMERAPPAFGNTLCRRAGSRRDIVARPEAVRGRRQLPPDSESRKIDRYRRVGPESRRLDRDTRHTLGSHRTCRKGAVSLPASHRERFQRRRRRYTRPGRRFAYGDDTPQFTRPPSWPRLAWRAPQRRPLALRAANKAARHDLSQPRHALCAEPIGVIAVIALPAELPQTLAVNIVTER